MKKGVWSCIPRHENFLYAPLQLYVRVIHKEKKKMNINLKKHNKHLLVLMLASILLTSAFVGVAFAFRSGTSAASPPADWVVFEGTSGNDYYDGRQYSYQINQWANETPAVY